MVNEVKKLLVFLFKCRYNCNSFMYLFRKSFIYEFEMFFYMVFFYKFRKWSRWFSKFFMWVMFIFIFFWLVFNIFENFMFE